MRGVSRAGRSDAGSAAFRRRRLEVDVDVGVAASGPEPVTVSATALPSDLSGLPSSTGAIGCGAIHPRRHRSTSRRRRRESARRRVSSRSMGERRRARRRARSSVRRVGEAGVGAAVMPPTSAPACCLPGSAIGGSRDRWEWSSSVLLGSVGIRSRQVSLPCIALAVGRRAIGRPDAADPPRVVRAMTPLRRSRARSCAAASRGWLRWSSSRSSSSRGGSPRSPATTSARARAAPCTSTACGSALTALFQPVVQWRGVRIDNAPWADSRRPFATLARRDGLLVAEPFAASAGDRADGAARRRGRPRAARRRPAQLASERSRLSRSGSLQGARDPGRAGEPALSHERLELDLGERARPEHDATDARHRRRERSRHDGRADADPLDVRGTGAAVPFTVECRDRARR